MKELNNDNFKKGSFMIMLENPIPNNVFDNPIYQIMSLDPTLRIVEGIVWTFWIPASRNVIEVFIDTYEQYTKVLKYLRLERYGKPYKYYTYDVDKEHIDCKFNYSHSREVCPLPSNLLDSLFFRHPDLLPIRTNGGSVYPYYSK